MFRYIPVFFLCTAGAFASICTTGDLPTVTLSVNGTPYVGEGFSVTTGGRDGACQITGTASGLGYSVTFLYGTVDQDPLIDFGLEFSSFDDESASPIQSFLQVPVPATDLLFELTIFSNYYGGPYDESSFFSGGNLINTSPGTEAFANYNNGFAPIQTTLVNGIIVDQQNYGCSTILTEAICNNPPPPSAPSAIAAPIVAGPGTMEMRLLFNLSAGDIFTLYGSSSFTALEAVPEPATISLIGAGLLALLGVARSRGRKA